MRREEGDVLVLSQLNDTDTQQWSMVQVERLDRVLRNQLPRFFFSFGLVHFAEIDYRELHRRRWMDHLPRLTAGDLERCAQNLMTPDDLRHGLLKHVDIQIT